MERYKFDLDSVLNKISILKNRKKIQYLESYSGSSCFEVNFKNCSYFLKITKGNVTKKMIKTYLSFQKANCNIAKFIECNYIEKENVTYIIYEFLNGETIKQKINTLTNNEIVVYAEKLVIELTKLMVSIPPLKEKQFVIDDYNNILNSSMEILKEYKKNVVIKNTYYLNLKKLSDTYIALLNKVKDHEIYFVHSDLNLSNLMIQKEKIYLLDIENSCCNFVGFNFKCLCWWLFENYSYKSKYLLFYKNVINKLELIFNVNMKEEMNLVMIYEYLSRIIRYKDNKQQIDYTLLKLSKLLNNISK